MNDKKVSALEKNVIFGQTEITAWSGLYRCTRKYKGLCYGDRFSDWITAINEPRQVDKCGNYKDYPGLSI